MMTWW